MIMRIFIFALVILIFFSYFQNEIFAEKASGKPIWQYGSATTHIVCGDRLCSETSNQKIPSWIKNNALWWSEGQIDDLSFLSGIEFLIEKKIIIISTISKNTSNTLPFVPNWIKDTAGWWAKDKVSDSDFLNGITWLVENGMIRINAPELTVTVTGDGMVRRGVTHTIGVDVTRNGVSIEGAWVVISIEDWGENVIREFDGYTDQKGYFEFSWEIPKSFDDIEDLLAIVSVSDEFSAKTVRYEFVVYCLPGEPGCKVEGN